MNYDDIKEQVVGRWNGVFNSLGIDVGDGRHGPCPLCDGGKDRFRFDDKEGKGTWFCNHCGAGDGWSLIQQKLGVDFKGAIAEVAEVIGSAQKVNKPKDSSLTPEQMREIFTSSSPIAKGDPAWNYLESRGIVRPPSTLRYHPACWESETKRNQKAMLSVFHDKNGQAVTMHRTYLDSDGNKLDIESPKKILPPIKQSANGTPLQMTGGAVKLYELTGEILAIAEGVETAIAAAEDLGIPTWSALTAQLLETFHPPRQVKHLIIIGDNDKNYAGQKAAYVAANRAEVMHKIRATVYLPEKPGTDWLDVYLDNKKNPPPVN